MGLFTNQSSMPISSFSPGQTAEANPACSQQEVALVAHPTMIRMLQANRDLHEQITNHIMDIMLPAEYQVLLRPLQPTLQSPNQLHSTTPIRTRSRCHPFRSSLRRHLKRNQRSRLFPLRGMRSSRCLQVLAVSLYFGYHTMAYLCDSSLAVIAAAYGSAPQSTQSTTSGAISGGTSSTSAPQRGPSPANPIDGGE